MSPAIVTVADFGLRTQAWAGKDTPVPERARPGVSLRPGWDSPKAKPTTFFYTSTWDPENRTTAWLDFMRRHGKRQVDGKQLWLLEPDPEATLYVIDSKADPCDFQGLVDAYPYRPSAPGLSRLPPGPDWDRIVQEHPFDGIHVTDNAVRSFQRHDGCHHCPFVGWDMESTVWLDFKLTPFEPPLPISDNWSLPAVP